MKLRKQKDLGIAWKPDLDMKGTLCHLRPRYEMSAYKYLEDFAYFCDI
jgi:hypothetical protein